MVMVRALLHFFNDDKPKETWSYELIAPTESQNKMSHSVNTEFQRMLTGNFSCEEIVKKCELSTHNIHGL